MDQRIKKYIQYKARTLEDRKKELARLKTERETLRQDIIDESPGGMDGMPRGKGKTSSPVESKVLRLEKVDRRIEVLDKELKKYIEVENKIRLMGREAYTIYSRTIASDMNPEFVALELGMCRATLFNVKGKLMEYIAEELGEYLGDRFDD